MNALNSILDKMVQMATQQLVLSMFGGGSFAGIPAFATGTSYAPGGMALVGEDGPEYVSLPRGSQVMPANQTRRMMEGSGSQNVHVTVGVDVDGSGNIMPFVKSISEQSAASAVRTAAPAIANQGAAQSRENYARSGGWSTL
jgi:hypothetical protein